MQQKYCFLDPDVDRRNQLADELDVLGGDTVPVRDIAEAISLLEMQSFDLVVTFDKSVIEYAKHVRDDTVCIFILGEEATDADFEQTKELRATVVRLPLPPRTTMGKVVAALIRPI